MLDKYPKIRPSMSNELAKIYVSYYRDNRAGNTLATSVAKKMESWLHRKVAKDVSLNDTCKATLEIGGGTLNQLQYEPELGPYDIIEPFKELYEGSKLLSRIRNVYSDISDIPDNQHYDRITSIATFEHICNLPDVIAKAGLLLKEQGSLRVSIPSEGTFLWALGWKLTTGPEFRIKYGLDYGELMRYEHVNTAREIEWLLSYFFKSIRYSVLGLTKNISFYQYFECMQPDLERCCTYLNQIESLKGDRNTCITNH